MRLLKSPAKIQQKIDIHNKNAKKDVFCGIFYEKSRKRLPNSLSGSLKIKIQKKS